MKGHWWAGRLATGHNLKTGRLRRYCAKRNSDNLVPSTILGIMDVNCLMKHYET